MGVGRAYRLPYIRCGRNVLWCRFLHQPEPHAAPRRLSGVSRRWNMRREAQPSVRQLRFVQSILSLQEAGAARHTARISNHRLVCSVAKKDWWGPDGSAKFLKCATDENNGGRCLGSVNCSQVLSLRLLADLPNAPPLKRLPPSLSLMLATSEGSPVLRACSGTRAVFARGAVLDTTPGLSTA
jgi:hypothetical protein